MSSTRRVRAGPAAGAAAGFAVAVAIATPASASQSPSAYVSYDTLTITGTNAADVLALRLAAGAPNTLQVEFGDDGVAEFSFDRTTFTKIDVFLRGGNDEYHVDQVNGTFVDEAITVDGGNGNDTMNGGDGAEVFYGGNGADTVDGNKGADTGYMGNGPDTFRWDPGDGSDIVEGQNGTDTLDFNGATGVENFALSANGTRSLFFRDAGNIRMDMNEVERLDLTALDGVDTVTVNDMSGTGFRQANIDLSGAAGGPDGAADVVTVNGTANADRVRVDTDGAQVDVKGLATQVHVTGSEVADQLKINTLDGQDVVKVDGSVFALISPSVDLGAQA
jgi:hypothetical protein